MGDGPTTARPFFFVHIMKTAGMSFNRQILANFERAAVYPGEDDQTGADYWVVARLRAAIATRADQIRIWRGHFPYFVTDLVPDAVTITVLREPVARTISLIDQHRRNNAPDQSLEQIYDDPQVFRRTVLNHQTKVLSMAESDDINAWTQWIDVDEGRLAMAKQRLAEVDVLGFQECFPEFLDVLDRVWGWRIRATEPVNAASEPAAVSAALRRRIADDNAIDMELYEFARSNY